MASLLSPAAVERKSFAVALEILVGYRRSGEGLDAAVDRTRTRSSLTVAPRWRKAATKAGTRCMTVLAQTGESAYTMRTPPCRAIISV